MSITLLNYKERYKTMSTRIIQKRRAVSPVIATVILIAVAVALGIAVAFWASGLTSSFSKYEKLGVNTQYATGSSANGWVIYLAGQNTGSSDASITQIQINGVPYPISGNTACSSLPTGSALAVCWTNAGTSVTTSNKLNQATLPVPSGSNFGIELGLPANPGASLANKVFADGQTIQVTIITAAGNNYPASIVLP
jgi:flagellin-like protein